MWKIHKPSAEKYGSWRWNRSCSWVQWNWSRNRPIVSYWELRKVKTIEDWELGQYCERAQRIENWEKWKPQPPKKKGNFFFFVVYGRIQVWLWVSTVHFFSFSFLFTLYIYIYIWMFWTLLLSQPRLYIWAQLLNAEISINLTARKRIYNQSPLVIKKKKKCWLSGNKWVNSAMLNLSTS